MEYITSQTPIRGSVIQENTFLTNDAIAQTPYKGANYSTILSSANGSTIQTPYVGVYYGPTIDLADGTMLLSPATTVPGHSGNTISVEVEIKDNGNTTISSRAYPVTADNIERPGEVIEYTVDGKTAYYPAPYEPEVPEGYIRCEFLESTGTQYINTGYVPNNETGLLVDQEKIVAGDTIPMGCRNSGADDTRFFATRCSALGETGNSPGCGWGQWIRFYSKITGRQIGKLNWLNNRVAEINTLTLSLDTLDFEPIQPIYIYAANIAGQASLNWGGRIYVAQISQGSETVHNYTPAITPAGVPCMYDKITKQPFYNAVTTPFIIGMTAAQALQLANLPADARTKTLTVSLPASIVSGSTITDAQVASAIETARSKGWTITVRTYTE